jgi:hypothetical protein
MKVELRNIKYAAFASQETSCFDATIYIDGKRAGYVRNDGTGGCHRYDPNQLEERIGEHALALPEYASQWNEGFSKEAKKRLVVDQLISALLEAYLLRKDYKRLIARTVAFVGKDGKLYELRSVPKSEHARAIERLKARADVDQVLNALPEDEGLALFAKIATLHEGAA